MNIRARQRSVPRSAALENDIHRINDIFTSAPERASGIGWLFGDYSIADAMFVPVALRFQTYGTWGLSERAIGYVEALTSDPLLATWIDAAHAESEVLPHEEVGV